MYVIYTYTYAYTYAYTYIYIYIYRRLVEGLLRMPLAGAVAFLRAVTIH